MTASQGFESADFLSEAVLKQNFGLSPDDPKCPTIRVLKNFHTRSLDPKP